MPPGEEHHLSHSPPGCWAQGHSSFLSLVLICFLEPQRICLHLLLHETLQPFGSCSNFVLRLLLSRLTSQFLQPLSKVVFRPSGRLFNLLWIPCILKWVSTSSTYSSGWLARNAQGICTHVRAHKVQTLCFCSPGLGWVNFLAALSQGSLTLTSWNNWHRFCPWLPGSQGASRVTIRNSMYSPPLCQALYLKCGRSYLIQSL